MECELASPQLAESRVFMELGLLSQVLASEQDGPGEEY